MFTLHLIPASGKMSQFIWKSQENVPDQVVLSQSHRTALLLKPEPREQFELLTVSIVVTFTLLNHTELLNVSSLWMFVTGAEPAGPSETSSELWRCSTHSLKHLRHNATPETPPE